MKNSNLEIRSTTILGVRIGNKIALGGDGQVTMGDIQMKSKAIKVRSFHNGQVLAGFAGAAADAMSLFEKFEVKLNDANGNLQRAVVDMAKEWRTDKMLKDLDALLAIKLPAIEVHITNIYNREEFRKKSLISKAAKGIICGFGVKGYIMALDSMKEILN